MNRCGNCGKYPFCEFTTTASQEACQNYIKREISDMEKIESNKEKRKMNYDKEFVNNKCYRCLNIKNDKDLCNIVKKVNNEYGCSNEDVVEIGDYIRNDDGFIGIVKEIRPANEEMESTYFVADTLASGYLEDIVMHGKKKIDVIKEGDYVNGYLVREIDGKLCNFDLNNMKWISLDEIDIFENVLTSELFEEYVNRFE